MLIWLHRIYPAIDPTSAWELQSFKGKAIFITGASRGIGRSTALTFAKAGAAIAIAARSASALDETEVLILQEVPNAKVMKYIVDVTKSAEMDAAVDGAVAALGSLDIVIANAGYSNSLDTRTLIRHSILVWCEFGLMDHHRHGPACICRLVAHPRDQSPGSV